MIEVNLKTVIKSLKVRGDVVILEVPQLSETMGTTGTILKSEEQLARERNELTSRNRLYEVVAVGHLITDFRIGDKCFVMPHAIVSFIDKDTDKSLIWCREDDIIGSVQRDNFDFKVPIPIHYQISKKEAQALNEGDDFLAID